MVQVQRTFGKTCIWLSQGFGAWSDWCYAANNWAQNALKSPMIPASSHLSIAEIAGNRFMLPSGKYSKFVDRWPELGLQFAEFEYTTDNPTDLVISAMVAGQTLIIVDIPKKFWDGLDNDGRLTHKLIGPAAVQRTLTEPQTASVTRLAGPQNALVTAGPMPQQAVLQSAPQSGPMLAANQGAVGGLTQLLQLKRPL